MVAKNKGNRKIKTSGKVEKLAEKSKKVGKSRGRKNKKNFFGAARLYTEKFSSNREELIF